MEHFNGRQTKVIRNAGANAFARFIHSSKCAFRSSSSEGYSYPYPSETTKLNWGRGKNTKVVRNYHAAPHCKDTSVGGYL
jgi:hypothetical protein